MQIIQDYILLINVFFWGILAYAEKRRIDRYIKNISDSEDLDLAKSLSKWIVAFFTIYFLVLFVFDHFDGQNPFDENRELNIFNISSGIFSIGYLSFLLYWMKIKNGAQLITKIGIFNIRSEKVALVLSSIICIGSIIGFIRFLLEGANII